MSSTNSGHNVRIIIKMFTCEFSLSEHLCQGLCQNINLAFCINFSANSMCTKATEFQAGIALKCAKQVVHQI